MNKQQRNLVTLVLTISIIVLFYLILSKRDLTNYNNKRPHKRAIKPISIENENQKLTNFTCPENPTFQLEKDKPYPDFFLIGVAKGGTTSFSNYLRQ